MKALRRICIVAGVVLMFGVPLGGASEPTGSAEEPGIEGAPKSDRADEMTAWSVDSGGGESSGGDFSLIAAIGQSDAGNLSQGDTVLNGGLWGGAVDLQILFYDGFETGGTGGWSSAVGGTKEEAP